MPIRASEKARYPKDWPEIRARILKRANNECEWIVERDGFKCSVPNGETVFRLKGDLERWRGFVSADTVEEDADWKAVKIVLTIAHHPDETIENCSDDNLHAWCQLHHLRADVGQHTRNAAETRKTKRDSARGLLNETI